MALFTIMASVLSLAGLSASAVTAIIAACYLFLRHAGTRNASMRNLVITVLGSLGAGCAASWLGSWSPVGIALGAWAFLLVLALADLLRGSTVSPPGTSDDFTRAAQALERSLPA